MHDWGHVWTKTQWVASSTTTGRAALWARIQYTELELYLENPETVDQVLEKLTSSPQIKRIWVNWTVFDDTPLQRISRTFPDIEVLPYKPLPQFRSAPN